MKNAAIEDLNAQGRMHQGEEQVLPVCVTRMWTDQKWWGSWKSH